MRIKLSCTKGLNIALDAELTELLSKFDMRAKLHFNPVARELTLVPSEAGFRFTKPAEHNPSGQCYVNIHINHGVGWPKHASVVMENLKEENGVFRCTLPKELPVPVSRAPMKKITKALPSNRDEVIFQSRLSLEKKANVILHCLGQDFCFSVPDDELLKLAMDFGSRGLKL